MGTPTTMARARSLALPTMALAMPPPASPTGVGSLVKKSRVRLLPPWMNRYPRIKTSVPAANRVHNPVMVNITALIILRRSVCRSRILGFVPIGSYDEQARDSVDDDGEGEEDQAQFDQGAGVELAGGFGELVGDYGGNGIAGGEEGGFDFGIVADDHGDGHGLAERTRQSQEDGTHDAFLGVGDDDIPSGLPAGGAEGQCGFALVTWNRQNHFARYR